MSTPGILVTAFGGPDSLDAVKSFMRNLMGREPSDELVARVKEHYVLIGGASPLLGIAQRFSARLQSELRRLGRDIPVAVGMVYWEPFIASGVKSLIEQGCDRIVLVSLSPFESKASSGATRDAVNAATATLGVEVVEAPLLSELGAYAEFYVRSLRSALAEIDPEVKPVVAFSAHSLPEADLIADDPYAAGLRATASAVAGALSLGAGHEEAQLGSLSAFGNEQGPAPWYLVYQSKGARPGRWLGPELSALIGQAADNGFGVVVNVPIGFATDHMETLYDLDVVAAQQAREADVGYARVAVANDDSALVANLAEALVPVL